VLNPCLNGFWTCSRGWSPPYVAKGTHAGQPRNRRSPGGAPGARCVSPVRFYGGQRSDLSPWKRVTKASAVLRRAAGKGIGECDPDSRARCGCLVALNKVWAALGLGVAPTTKLGAEVASRTRAGTGAGIEPVSSSRYMGRRPLSSFGRPSRTVNSKEELMEQERFTEDESRCCSTPGHCAGKARRSVRRTSTSPNAPTSSRGGWLERRWNDENGDIVFRWSQQAEAALDINRLTETAKASLN
jgi:hypothetical protein